MMSGTETRLKDLDMKMYTAARVKIIMIEVTIFVAMAVSSSKVVDIGSTMVTETDKVDMSGVSLLVDADESVTKDKLLTEVANGLADILQNWNINRRSGYHVDESGYTSFFSGTTFPEIRCASTIEELVTNMRAIEIQDMAESKVAEMKAYADYLYMGHESWIKMGS
jgi:hypothetical protein